MMNLIDCFYSKTSRKLNKIRIDIVLSIFREILSTYVSELIGPVSSNDIRNIIVPSFFSRRCCVIQIIYYFA